MANTFNKKVEEAGTDASEEAKELSIQEVRELLEKVIIPKEEIKRIFRKVIDDQNTQLLKMFVLRFGPKIEVLNDSTKETVIHLAFTKKLFGVIRLLFQHCDYAVNYTDVNGFSHFHIACIMGFANMVEEFIKKGVDVNHRLHDSSHDSVNEYTPLHFAVKNAKLEVVEILLKHKAEVNATSFDGSKPLHLACAIAKPLVGNQLQPVPFDKTHDIKYSMFFHKISVPIIKALLSHRADAKTLFGEKKDTILHRAIRDLTPLRDASTFEGPIFDDELHTELVGAVLQAGADANAKNRDGETPLSIAVSMLGAGIVRVLLSHGADISHIKMGEFCHPDVLPRSVAIENLIDIVSMRESRGFHLSQDERLAVLRFSICNDKGYEYTDADDAKARYKLQNLLEYGTDENIIRVLNIISTKVSKQSEYYDEINAKVSEYLLKLHAIGLHQSPKVRDCMRNISPSFNENVPGQLRKEYQLEANQIKTFKLTNNKTFIEMLTGPLDELYSFLRNSDYRKRYYNALTGYLDDFPYFNGIIDGYFAKCLIRKFVEKTASDYMSAASPTADKSCETISSDLSNEDLLNMCLSSSERHENTV